MMIQRHPSFVRQSSSLVCEGTSWRCDGICDKPDELVWDFSDPRIRSIWNKHFRAIPPTLFAALNYKNFVLCKRENLKKKIFTGPVNWSLALGSKLTWLILRLEKYRRKWKCYNCIVFISNQNAAMDNHLKFVQGFLRSIHKDFRFIFLLRS
jgi:hypothetical protein